LPKDKVVASGYANAPSLSGRARREANLDPKWTPSGADSTGSKVRASLPSADS